MFNQYINVTVENTMDKQQVTADISVDTPNSLFERAGVNVGNATIYNGGTPLGGEKANQTLEQLGLTTEGLRLTAVVNAKNA